MKRVLLVLGMMVLVAQIVTAQLRHDANWVFGEGAGMHFNEDGTVSTFKTDTYNWEANATISDSAGNLLFYLVDNTGNYYMILRPGPNTVIGNNDSIYSNASISNGGIFLPSSNANTYGFYHIGLPPNSQLGFLYLYNTTIVQRNSKWQLDQKNSLLLSQPVLEKIAVVKHSDGNCFWMVVQKDERFACNSGFVTLKICNNVILDSFETIVNRNYCLTDNIGDMEFSQDGKLMVNTIGDGYLETFTFDRCTGSLLPHHLIQTQGDGQVYGTAFSIDGQKLYLSKNADLNSGSGGRRVYQYNFDDSILTLLHDFGGGYIGSGQMERGPNGKIYTSSCGYWCRNEYTSFTQCLSVINNPNAVGLACDFQPESFCFPDSARITLGLPNFPNYNLGAEGAYRASAGSDKMVCTRNTLQVTLGTPSVPGIAYSWSCDICPALSALNVAQPTITGILTRDTWYYLTATDTAASACTSVFTDTVLVKLDTCTGITETPAIQAKLYPNPTNGQLTIELPVFSTGYTFKLFNLLGQQVYEADLTAHQTVLALDYPPGIYLYQIAIGAMVLNGKLVMR